jgi:uncharacterized protein (DUF4415 family)
LKKVDAHVITNAEYAEIPELGDDFFANADEHVGGVLVKRGRPVGSNKTQMNLRIDNDLIDAYKRQGDGWQTRMNDALRDWAKLHGILA